MNTQQLQLLALLLWAIVTALLIIMAYARGRSEGYELGFRDGLFEGRTGERLKDRGTP